MLAVLTVPSTGAVVARAATEPPPIPIPAAGAEPGFSSLVADTIPTKATAGADPPAYQSSTVQDLVAFGSNQIGYDPSRQVVYSVVGFVPEVVTLSPSSLEVLERTILPGSPRSFSLSDDMETLAIRMDDNSLVLLDLSTKTVDVIDLSAWLGTSFFVIDASLPGRVYAGSDRGIVMVDTSNLSVTSLWAGLYFIDDLRVDTTGSALYIRGPKLRKFDLTVSPAALVAETSLPLFGTPPGFDLSPDGREVRVGDMFFDTDTFHVIRTIATPDFRRSVVSPDWSKLHIISAEDPRPFNTTIVETYDIATGSRLGATSNACQSHNSGSERQPVLLPDQGQILIATFDYLCRSLLPTEAEYTPPTDQLGGTVGDVEADPLRGLVYASIPRRHEIAVLDMGTWRVVRRIRVGSLPAGLDLSRDGNRLFVALEGAGSAAIVDLSLQRLERTLDLQYALDHHAVSLVTEGEPGRLFAAAAESGQVADIDLDNGYTVSRLEVSNFVPYPKAMAATADGSWLYMTGSQGVVKLDVRTKPSTVVGIAPDFGGNQLILSTDNRIFVGNGVLNPDLTVVAAGRSVTNNPIGSGESRVTLDRLHGRRLTIEIETVPGGVVTHSSQTTCGRSQPYDIPPSTLHQVDAQPRSVIQYHDVLCLISSPAPVRATIEGRVVTGLPEYGLAEACVEAFKLDPITGIYRDVRTTVSDANGQYTLRLGQAGRYKVAFWDCRRLRFAVAFAGDAASLGASPTFDVAIGTRTNVAGSMVDAITWNGPADPGYHFLPPGLHVVFLDASGYPHPRHSDSTNGVFIHGLDPRRQYRAYIEDTLGRYPSYYYKDKSTFTQASVLTAEDGGPFRINPPIVGLVDPSTGKWFIRSFGGTRSTQFYYGNPGDTPFMGDWDCDGVSTPGLYRRSDGYAYLRNSNAEGVADIKFFFGNPGDIPLAGDWDHDGCDTLSIYRPSNQRFYIINRLGSNDRGLGAADYSFIFGNPGDQPVVGNWDGDDRDEIGLYRRSSGFFYYRNSLDTGVATGSFFFGEPNDRFIAGDWGFVDGVETPAVFRPETARLYFRFSLSAGNSDMSFPWGASEWIPVSGDGTIVSP
jgi:DNA-binding beta-propeller fold protein YncE